MRSLIVLAFASAAMVSPARRAHAQVLPSHTPSQAVPPAPEAKPRIGYGAPPAPPAQPQPAQRGQGPVYIVTPVYYYDAYGQLLGAPYVVLSDGSVLVNFGGGYERVLRACQVAQPATPRDPWERDALGRIPDPPGIAAMNAGTRGAAYGVAPQQSVGACFRHSRGRVEVALQ